MTGRAPVRKMLLGSFTEPIDAIEDQTESKPDIAVKFFHLFEQFATSK